MSKIHFRKKSNQPPESWGSNEILGIDIQSDNYLIKKQVAGVIMSDLINNNIMNPLDIEFFDIKRYYETQEALSWTKEYEDVVIYYGDFVADGVYGVIRGLFIVML